MGDAAGRNFSTFSIILNFTNPGGENGAYGLTDPSAGLFGCGCATPDVAAANPVLGSGSNRTIQLGLKFIF